MISYQDINTDKSQVDSLSTEDALTIDSAEDIIQDTIDLKQFTAEENSTSRDIDLEVDNIPIIDSSQVIEDNSLEDNNQTAIDFSQFMDDSTSGDHFYLVEDNIQTTNNLEQFCDSSTSEDSDEFPLYTTHVSAPNFIQFKDTDNNEGPNEPVPTHEYLNMDSESTSEEYIHEFVNEIKNNEVQNVQFSESSEDEVPPEIIHFSPVKDVAQQDSLDDFSSGSGEINLATIRNRMHGQNATKNRFSSSSEEMDFEGFEDTSSDEFVIQRSTPDNSPLPRGDMLIFQDSSSEVDINAYRDSSEDSWGFDKEQTVDISKSTINSTLEERKEVRIRIEDADVDIDKRKKEKKREVHKAHKYAKILDVHVRSLQLPRRRQIQRLLLIQMGLLVIFIFLVYLNNI
eukprot:TRINITY_DN2712_c0_g1_i1.p1 TRINITY_DN2712_c0_g1~~TRINITY_DN2712_c0_g1_i1.p1  ORF type:complete len:399 (-),score=112.85 TRINITY_DN2712_c0_g1_i1:23-1219(-)